MNCCVRVGFVKKDFKHKKNMLSFVRWILNGALPRFVKNYNFQNSIQNVSYKKTNELVMTRPFCSRQLFESFPEDLLRC